MRYKIFLLFSTTLFLITSGFFVYQYRPSFEPASPLTTSSSILSSSEIKPSTTSSNTTIEEQQTISPPETVSLIAVGDIMLSRVVGQKITANGINYPFAKTAEYLTDADITFANLEAPISPGREIKSGEMSFRINPGVEQAIKDAGIDIVSLANNHTPNFGETGLKNTFKYLKDAGIQYVGAGTNASEARAPIFMKTKDITFAFLAYNDTDVVPPSYEATDKRAGTNFMRIEELNRAVKAVRSKADVVIVSMHSGTEYVDYANKSQTAFAHAAIDAGADLVIGHHPHVVQPVEKYQGKFILYSLGNFIFDQMWSEDTRRGMTAKIEFTKTGVEKITFKPVLIENFAQPHMIEGVDVENVLKRLKLPLSEKYELCTDDPCASF